MRIVYFTIDNINDNVILAQTFPFLGRLAALPGVNGIDLFALRKNGGDRYRAALPSAAIRVRLGRNHGIWHPLTLLHLARFAFAAWRRAQPGTVLIGRNPVSLLCLAPAAARRRTRLVLDYRGLLSEEYVLQGKVAQRGRMHRLLRYLEGWALRRADVIVCVSERLRSRAQRWKPSTRGKTVVVPCCYDPLIAQQDEREMARLREEFNLDRTRDFVLCYAGSLSAWNRPEAILEVSRAFRREYPATRLLLLTGDLEKAGMIFRNEEGVLLCSVSHQEIRNYLALADLGLLLREPGPVNRVASPVKFAEYLACGLPVLVSPGVGDCPDIVRRERVGYVLDASVRLAQIASEILANRSTLRDRCREVAARYFDGDRYLGHYTDLVAGTSAQRVAESATVGKTCA